MPMRHNPPPPRPHQPHRNPMMPPPPPRHGGCGCLTTLMIGAILTTLIL